MKEMKVMIVVKVVKDIHRLALGYALAITALALTASAWAQSSLVLYGVADVGIEYLSHADASGNALTRMASGNLSGSRWGLRGTEDLGGGTSALFVLESGFDIDAGTLGQAGRLFGRQAYTGLNTPYGRITAGHQNNLLYEILINYDAMAIAPRYSAFLMDSALAGRYDNAAKYIGKFGGLTASAMYAFARGTSVTSGATSTITSETAGNARNDRAWSAALEYTTGNAGATVIYDQQQGTTGLAGQNPAQRDRRIAVAGSYAFAKAKVFAGYRWLSGDIGSTATVAARRNDLFWLGASYAFTPALTLSASAYVMNDKRSAQDPWSLVGTLDYALSKRTDGYLTLGYVKNKDGSRVGLNGIQTSIGPGMNQLGVVAGVRHKF